MNRLGFGKWLNYNSQFWKANLAHLFHSLKGNLPKTSQLPEVTLRAMLYDVPIPCLPLWKVSLLCLGLLLLVASLLLLHGLHWNQEADLNHQKRATTHSFFTGAGLVGTFHNALGKECWLTLWNAAAGWVSKMCLERQKGNQPFHLWRATKAPKQKVISVHSFFLWRPKRFNSKTSCSAIFLILCAYPPLLPRPHTMPLSTHQPVGVEANFS